MGKQSNEEIRKGVLEQDSIKDVNIYLAIPVGVVAGVSAMAGVCAVICMRALVYFRAGVDAYWLSCVPFLFPVITGIFAAYKKQFSLFGVHLTVTLLALLMGGFGLGLSVEPIFINRRECVPVTPSVACDKSSLAFLYLVAGSVAAGFALLGFLLTLCALNSATKRIAERRHQEELEHLREQEAKQKELRQMKSHGDVKASVFSVSSQSAVNGIPQGSPPGNSQATLENKGADNVTTKL